MNQWKPAALVMLVIPNKNKNAQSTLSTHGFGAVSRSTIYLTHSEVMLGEQNAADHKSYLIFTTR